MNPFLYLYSLIFPISFPLPVVLYFLSHFCSSGNCWLQAGRERQSAFCLMQKFVDLQSLGSKMQIISAFAVDHIKGFIFIEADKQCDINEVLS